MQDGDLVKTKVLKTQRHSKIDERKPKFQSVLKSLLPVRPVSHISQTSWTYSRISLVHQTYPVPYPGSTEVFWTCPPPSPAMSDLTALTRVKSSESDMFGSKADFQRDFWTCSVLDQTYLVNFMIVVI
jgi:hypothetical protein